MSSPTSRRSNRNSVNGTPRRNTNSEASMIDAPLPDAPAENQQQQQQQQQSQNGQVSQQNTPRGNPQSSQNDSQSQAPPTSSPLFFRSSPAGSQSQSQSQSLNVPPTNGVSGGSPLQQQSDAPSGEEGRTPRPTGGYGGKPADICEKRAVAKRDLQNHHLSTTHPAQTLQVQHWTGVAQTVPALMACSCALLGQAAVPTL